jgi:hypothetical protein
LCQHHENLLRDILRQVVVTELAKRSGKHETYVSFHEMCKSLRRTSLGVLAQPFDVLIHRSHILRPPPQRRYGMAGPSLSRPPSVRRYIRERELVCEADFRRSS